MLGIRVAARLVGAEVVLLYQLAVGHQSVGGCWLVAVLVLMRLVVPHRRESKCRLWLW